METPEDKISLDGEEVIRSAPEAPEVADTDIASVKSDVMADDAEVGKRKDDEAHLVTEEAPGAEKRDKETLNDTLGGVFPHGYTKDATEEEEPFFCSPFRPGMDDLQKKMRIFLLLGILPLPYVGWLIGFFIGLIGEKTKAIHKKLLGCTLSLLFVVGGVIIGLLVAFTGKSTLHDPGTIMVDIKAPECASLSVEIKAMIQPSLADVMVFAFEKSDPSWKESELFDVASKQGYSVVGVSFEYPKDKPIVSDEVYGLSKYADLMKCLQVAKQKRLTLVARFDEDDATKFKTDSKKDAYYAVLAVNDKEPITYAYPAMLETPAVSSHISFFNTRITCGDKIAIPAVEFTTDGQVSYRKSYSSYDYIKSVFHPKVPLERATRPLAIDTPEGFKKFEMSLAEPLKRLIDYSRAIDSTGLYHDVVCAKAEYVASY